MAAPGLPASRAHAQAAAAADAAYAAISAWLFDLYLQRSAQLTIANAARSLPGAVDVLQPRVPAMLAVLARHRDGFDVAMQRALRAQMPAATALALQRNLAVTPVPLDAATRGSLLAVDAEFRREAQVVIGAITGDLASMVADTLSRSATGSIR
jgi:hypothetical protein